MFFEGLQIKTFFRWVFYIFIALFPFILYPGYIFNGTATRAINTVLVAEIIAVVLGFFFLFRQRKLSVVISPITGTLFLFLAVLFVSSFSGVDFSASFWSKATRTTGLFYFIHLALLYFCFWVSFREEKYLRTFIKTFLVSTGIFSVLAVLGQEGVGWLFADKPWAGLTIGNSTFAGMYLYAAFMLSIYFLATLPEKSRRWWKNLLPLIFVLNPYLINFDVFRGTADIFKNPATIVGSAQASSVTLLLSAIILVVGYLVWKIKEVSIRRTILFLTVAVSVIVFIVGVRSLLTPGGKVQQLYLTQSSATRPIR